MRSRATRRYPSTSHVRGVQRARLLCAMQSARQRAQTTPATSADPVHQVGEAVLAHCLLGTAPLTPSKQSPDQQQTLTANHSQEQKWHLPASGAYRAGASYRSRAIARSLLGIVSYRQRRLAVLPALLRRSRSTVPPCLIAGKPAAKPGNVAARSGIVSRARSGRTVV